MSDLYIKDSNGEYRNAELEDLIAATRRALRRRFRRGKPIRSPRDTIDFLIAELAPERNEVFAAIFLDTKHHIISFERLFTGTVDGTSVYPRVIATRALEVNAAAVIFSHCHPTGIPEPSDADIRITKRLKSALELLEIRTLDHIIVGGDKAVSLASRGLM